MPKAGGTGTRSSVRAAEKAALEAEQAAAKKALGMLDGEVRSYWALPGETRTLHWKQSKMNDMLALFLGARGVVAPEGFAYTYHSCGTWLRLA